MSLATKTKNDHVIGDSINCDEFYVTNWITEKVIEKPKEFAETLVHLGKYAAEIRQSQGEKEPKQLVLQCDEKSFAAIKIEVYDVLKEEQETGTTD